MDALRPLPRNRRLKAATLLESVLAMGLLAAVMSLAVLMHARTLATSRGQVRLRAWAATETALVGIAHGVPVDHAWPAPPGLTLKAEGTVIAPGLRSVRLSCSGATGVLLERHVILPIP